MVKLVKRGLYDVIKPGLMTDEELLTAIKQVEGLINARPLCRVSSDPKDEKVLTPAHFLVREPYCDLTAIPKDWDHRERYLHIQNILNTFWQRFLKEIVPLKNEILGKVRITDQYRIGDLVILMEDLDRTNNKHWPVARIVDLERSHDDLIRKAKLSFNGKIYSRCTKSFAPMFRKDLGW